MHACKVLSALTGLLCFASIGSSNEHNGADDFEPLKIALLLSSDSTEIPGHIHKGLLDAVRNLHDVVRVRKQEPDLDLKKLEKCYEPDVHWPWSLVVETAINDYQVENASGERVSMTPSWVIQEKVVRDMDDVWQLAQYGNYLLLVQVNEGECHKDPSLMAAASPCLFRRRSHSSVPRPALGHLVICLSSPTWQQFSSAYDLFRHEILHALGFGIFKSERQEDKGSSATLEWNTNERTSPVQHQVQYMDFGHRAMEFAREHFACQDLQGIEADNEKATHLSEYTFGNELMTPVVSSGKNYLTFLSATILEDTYLGETSWYKVNRDVVHKETEAYWYGRGLGCDFLHRSCWDFIDSQAEQGKPAFPFCYEAELVREVTAQRGHPVCFTNGSKTVTKRAGCNVVRGVESSPHDQFQPTVLQTMSPKLREELAPGEPLLFGSDALHRFCPFVEEVLVGHLVGIPPNAIAVPC